MKVTEITIFVKPDAVPTYTKPDPIPTIEHDGQVYNLSEEQIFVGSPVTTVDSAKVNGYYLVSLGLDPTTGQLGTCYYSLDDIDWDQLRVVEVEASDTVRGKLDELLRLMSDQSQRTQAMLTAASAATVTQIVLMLDSLNAISIQNDNIEALIKRIMTLLLVPR